MENTSPMGFLSFSKEYLQAALLLEKHTKKGTSELVMVKYYLLGHSIELVLKSYLKYKEFEYDGLKKIGHDLKRLCREAEKNNIADIFDISLCRSEILLLNDSYSRKELEYIRVGFSSYPKFNVLAFISATLIAHIGELIVNNTAYQDSSFIKERMKQMNEENKKTI